MTLSNGRLALTIDAATGWLGSYSDTLTGVALPLVQSWRSYVGANGSNINGSTQASPRCMHR